MRSLPASQTVAPEDVVHLANAAPYLTSTDRARLLEGLARSVIAAVAATSSPGAAATDMSRSALAGTLREAVAASDALHLAASPRLGR